MGGVGGLRFVHKPAISRNQSMIVGGLMKRLLRQLPVDIPGEKGRTTNLASQVSNLLIRMKERTSVKPIYAETFSIDL